MQQPPQRRSSQAFDRYRCPRDQGTLESTGLDGNREASGWLGEVESAKCSTQPAEDVVEWRQGAHLVGQALGPQCLEPCFLTKDGAAEICEGSLTKFKFLANGVGQLIEFDARVGRQVPQIVEIARFVARRVRQGDGFLSDDFFERVSLNQAFSRKVGEFVVAA